MGALLNMLVFCETNACTLESQPRAATVHMMLDHEYPRVPSMFTCPAGEPPAPPGDVRQSILVGWQMIGKPNGEVSAEDDADLTAYIDMRFKRASEAWVFRVNFCKGFPVDPPETPPAPREPADAPFPPLSQAPRRAGFDFQLITLAALGIGLVLANKAQTR